MKVCYSQLLIHINPISQFQEQLFEKEVGLTEDLTAILNELTTLSKTENAKVALKARQVSGLFPALIVKVRTLGPYSLTFG